MIAVFLLSTIMNSCKRKIAPIFRMNFMSQVILCKTAHQKIFFSNLAPHLYAYKCLTEYKFVDYN